MFRKPSKPSAPKPFQLVPPVKPWIYQAEGVLYGTFADQKTEILQYTKHFLRCGRYLSMPTLSARLPISRSGVKTLLEAERRTQDQKVLAQFLGLVINGQVQVQTRRLTHYFELGYYASDSSTRLVFSGGFNCQVQGFSTDSAAKFCAEILHKMMMAEPISLNNGVLIPSRVLLNPEIDSALWWSAIAFRAYLSLVNMGVSDRVKPTITLVPKKEEKE